MNLAATKSKLNIPHVRVHLPQDKPAGLGSLGGVPAARDLVGCLKLRGYHPHLPHGISIVNRILKLLPPRSSNVLLQYVLSRRSFLQQNHLILRNHHKTRSTLILSSFTSNTHFPFIFPNVT